jgi:hypothetical protein
MKHKGKVSPSVILTHTGTSVLSIYSCDTPIYHICAYGMAPTVKIRVVDPD